MTDNNVGFIVIHDVLLTALDLPLDPVIDTVNGQSISVCIYINLMIKVLFGLNADILHGWLRSVLLRVTSKLVGYSG